MLAMAEFETDTDETVSCNGCQIDGLAEMESYFSEIADGCRAGHWIGESGYYCDDCYPRCYCLDCL